MNESTLAAIQSTFAASHQGSIHFGQVIGQLMSVQVESYHVDYRSGRTTYYLPDGATGSLMVACEPASEGSGGSVSGSSAEATATSSSESTGCVLPTGANVGHDARRETRDARRETRDAIPAPTTGSSKRT